MLLTSMLALMSLRNHFARPDQGVSCASTAAALPSVYCITTVHTEPEVRPWTLGCHMSASKGLTFKQPARTAVAKLTPAAAYANEHGLVLYGSAER